MQLGMHRLILSLEEAYTHSSAGSSEWAGITKEPEDWSRFDIMMPAVDVCPLTAIGKPGEDGGKLICGIEQIPATAERPCIIYSIGGKNHWDFEESLYDKTNCSVFTFDCTCDGSNMPQHIQDRVVFNRICLGDDGTNSETHRSLSQLMSIFNHSYVTLLKADIVSPTNNTRGDRSHLSWLLQ
jgi:hypothetical protein